MKKLLFLLAGAFLAFSASAHTPQASVLSVSTAWYPDDLEIVKAGFFPEYYEGELCAIFVTVERVKGDGSLTRLVDPKPHVYKVRYNGEAWVDITDQVLISYDVWFETTHESYGGSTGVLHYSFTYKYGDGPVQTNSGSIDSYV